MNQTEQIAMLQEALDDITLMYNARCVARTALAATAAQEDSQPKLTLALPDYEKRKIVIASDELIDGERLVCVAIQPAQEVQEPILNGAGKPTMTSDAIRSIAERHFSEDANIVQCCLAIKRAFEAVPSQNAQEPVAWLGIAKEGKPNTYLALTNSSRNDSMNWTPLYTHPDSNARDAERLKGLIKLCGYVQEGSDTIVKLFQDDATMFWHVQLGNRGQSHYGPSARHAIDAAIAATKEAGK